MEGRFLASFPSTTTSEYNVLYLVNYDGSEKCGSLLFKIVGVRKQSPTRDTKGLICLWLSLQGVLDTSAQISSVQL